MSRQLLADLGFEVLMKLLHNLLIAAAAIGIVVGAGAVTNDLPETLDYLCMESVLYEGVGCWYPEGASAE